MRIDSLGVFHLARRIRVAVLFGGKSAEHSVSLQSAQSVLEALDRDRFEVLPVGITPEGRFLVAGDPMAALTGASGEEPETRALQPLQAGSDLQSVDVVFPVLHGPYGEDGTLQGFLELAGVPYVGAGVLGSAVGMDKAIMKMVFEQAGLPVAPWRLLLRSEVDDRELVAERLRDLRMPLFVKPANMGSSVGISRVAEPEDLDRALRDAAQYDRRVVVEQGVDARELECGVLGNDRPQASVVGEVVSSGTFYDFTAKYDGSSRIVIPADLPPQTARTIQELAVRAFTAIDAAGMARADFFLDRGTGRVYINELNTIPGFTRYSMFPMLWEASGLEFPGLCTRLVELAIQRHAERNRASGRESQQEG